jgi:small lipoprotein (TIGR04454 family)
MKERTMMRMLLVVLLGMFVMGCGGQSKGECEKAYSNLAKLTQEQIVKAQTASGKSEDDARREAARALENLKGDDWVKACSAAQGWDLKCMQEAKDLADLAACKKG